MHHAGDDGTAHAILADVARVRRLTMDWNAMVNSNSRPAPARQSCKGTDASMHRFCRYTIAFRICASASVRSRIPASFSDAMYAQFFRLTQAPFSIAPDPRYLYMSERHREALAHLLYGAGSGGGIVLLTGEIGAGKTTICRCFLEQVPARCEVGYIFNPKLTVQELLEAICTEFHIDLPRAYGQSSLKECIDALNAHLLALHAQGRNGVLVIDEAQNLSADVLEQLRLLTNLETNERKLLQIILIGQPELRTMLARPELEQLAQRVIARYHLDALTPAETAGYIEHRLATAGLQTVSPIPRALMKRIHRLTQGVPRRINLLCDRALLGAYAEGASQVTRPILDRAARELFVRGGAAPMRWRHAALAISGVMLAAGAAAWTMARYQMPAVKPQQAAVAPASAQPEPAVSTTAALKKAGEKQAEKQEILAASGTATAISLANEEDALRQLAGLWGAHLQEGDVCAQGALANLRCYRGTKGIAELRRIDRPVVLALPDAAGRSRYVLLTELTENGATLRAGEATQTIDLLTFTRHFNGEFATFWRAPQGFGESLKVGDSGPAAGWVAVQLAKLNGDSPPTDNRFDQQAQLRLQQFQTVQGLAADGIAGPVTLMQLNRIAGVAEPGLRAGAVALQTAQGKE
jgi:general secretion pathway protein A